MVPSVINGRSHFPNSSSSATRIFGHPVVVFAGEQALAERGKIHHAHAIFLTDREAFVFPVPLQRFSTGWLETGRCQPFARQMPCASSI